MQVVRGAVVGGLAGEPFGLGMIPGFLQERHELEQRLTVIDAHSLAQQNLRALTVSRCLFQFGQPVHGLDVASIDGCLQ
ncbi:hypothetical protein AQJ91_05940 [Streptomyces dysideae]|uniref:Uncharacterized protein n=1 Tax=Streptomyces dysideae TaxID=909626 RepID=A0A101V410_9ACTN|nr:hypothetical protein AQJ91_05940 [Streptomyces dysideae]